MKKLLPVIFMAVVCIYSCDKKVYAQEVKHSAEKFTLSKSDVNRIICPAPIKDVIFSEEKGLTSKVVGNEVFIKFPVTIIVNQETMEKTTTYSNTSAEVFLVCGGETYNLILTPAKIAAQTVELKPKTPLINELKGKDTEEILGALIGLAIEDDMPGSFKTEDKNISYKINRLGGNLDVIFRKVSKGGGFEVKEFHIYSPVEITMLPTELMGFPDITKPLAITLTSEKFKGWVRGFVIEASK